MHPLRFAIQRFDNLLCRLEAVAPFADEPGIILRIQRVPAAWDIPLPGQSISKGTPVLSVHLWNERVPAIASEGANLRWALSFHRSLLHSFTALAVFMQQTASMDDIQAVGGILPHIHTRASDGGRQFLEGLGFTILPYHRPAGAFGEFWENFYSWLLIWAYNPGSLQSHALFGMQRNEFWMTREHFLTRFAKRPPRDDSRTV